MSTLIDFALLSFGSLFAILSPFGTVPTFLAITEGNTADERLRMVRIASLTIAVVLSGFVIVGPWIFTIFQVTAPAFKAAGGIILLRAGLDMLNARRSVMKETPVEREEGAEKDDIAITPLAIPMIVGPGSIVTVILLSHRATGAEQYIILIANIVLLAGITFVVLRAAALYSWVLGATTIRIIGRIMGLLLAVIAMQFLFNGIAEFLRDVVAPFFDS